MVTQKKMCYYTRSHPEVEKSVSNCLLGTAAWMSQASNLKVSQTELLISIHLFPNLRPRPFSPQLMALASIVVLAPNLVVFLASCLTASTPAPNLIYLISSTLRVCLKSNIFQTSTSVTRALITGFNWLLYFHSYFSLQFLFHL